MSTRDYPFQSGARTALTVAGVLCLVVIVAIPFGIWILVRAAGGKVTLTDTGLTAKALGTVNVDFADVQRWGIWRVAITERGVGGALAKQKVGGDEGINLCFMTRAGKTRKFTVSQYQRHEEITSEIARILGKQPETLSMGTFGPKWPDKPAA